MAAAKVAITLEREMLQALDGLVAQGQFASRSQAIQSAVRENLTRWKRVRLARALDRLDVKEHRAMAEERFRGEVPWPEY